MKHPTPAQREVMEMIAYPKGEIRVYQFPSIYTDWSTLENAWVYGGQWGSHESLNLNVYRALLKRGWIIETSKHETTHNYAGKDYVETQLVFVLSEAGKTAIASQIPMV